MERAASAPPKPLSETESTGSRAAVSPARPLRLSGSVPAAVLDSGNAAHLFGYVALKRALASLGGWLGVRRTASITLDQDHCTYREKLDLLGLEAKSSEEVIPHRAIQSIETARVASTWPVVLGALVLLVGATWGLLRLAEGIFGKDSGLLAQGIGILAVSLAADLALAFLAVRLLPRRWQVRLTLRSGKTRILETASQRDAELLRDTLAKKLVH